MPMSERLFKINLDELETIRLVCQVNQCGGVAELSLGQLAAKTSPTCPACGGSFINDHRLPHQALAKAIEQIRGQNASVRVEFVLPDNTAN